VALPVCTKEVLTTESQRYNCSTSSGGNTSCTRLGWSLKVASLPLALAIDGLVTRYGEIIITRKNHQKNNEIEVIPKRGGKTSSWKRVEEYRLNKPIC
jgi:hypothetical protein